MILVDAAYWPLVVIGPVKSAAAATAPEQATLARLVSREPRAIALVIPGHGDEAAGALDALLAWLKDFDGAVFGPARRLAWVAPDRALRSTLDAMLAQQHARAFGRPSSTFASLLPALLWLFEAVRDAGARHVPLPAERSRRCYVPGCGR